MLGDEVIAMETNVVGYEVIFKIEEVSITFFFLERAEKIIISIDNTSVIEFVS